MIPYSVMSTEYLKLPTNKLDDCTEQIKMFPLNGGARSDLSNVKVIQKALVHVWTNKEIRAAHIFKFEKKKVDWHLFEPLDDPLNHNELKGQMIFSIKTIQRALFHSEAIIGHSEKKKYIEKKSEIIKVLNSIEPTDNIYIVLVFKDFIFAGGNYCDETTFCKAIVHYEPTIRREVYDWPKMDKFQRLLYDSEQKPIKLGITQSKFIPS